MVYVFIRRMLNNEKSLLYSYVRLPTIKVTRWLLAIQAMLVWLFWEAQLFYHAIHGMTVEDNTFDLLSWGHLFTCER